MLATKIYDLVTKFFPSVASCLLSKKVNFEPCNLFITTVGSIKQMRRVIFHWLSATKIIVENVFLTHCWGLGKGHVTLKQAVVFVAYTVTDLTPAHPPPLEFLFEYCVQGCALAEPSGPWWLTFALGRLENFFFHTNHMLGTLDFTVSEHWAPFNFP